MHHFNYTTDYRVQPVIEAYKEGKGVVDIQRSLGLSAGTIYRILDKHNVSRRFTHKHFTNEALQRLTLVDIHQIIDDYNAGVPITDLQENWNLNKNAIYVILDKKDKHYQTKVHKPTKNLWELVE